MKLFRIYEEDLQRLEYALPRLFDVLGERMNDPANQVLFEECKEIVANARWDYGPHTNVQIIRPDDDPTPSAPARE